jgi:hypothetical protein
MTGLELLKQLKMGDRMRLGNGDLCEIDIDGDPVLEGSTNRWPALSELRAENATRVEPEPKLKAEIRTYKTPFRYSDSYFRDAGTEVFYLGVDKKEAEIHVARLNATVEKARADGIKDGYQEGAAVAYERGLADAAKSPEPFQIILGIQCPKCRTRLKSTVTPVDFPAELQDGLGEP